MFGAYGIKNIVAHQHWAGFKIKKRNAKNGEYVKYI